MKIFKIRVNGKSYQVEVEEEGTSPALPPKPVLPKSPPPVQGIPQPVAMPTSRPRFRAVLKPWLTHPCREPYSPSK